MDAYAMSALAGGQNPMGSMEQHRVRGFELVGGGGRPPPPVGGFYAQEPELGGGPPSSKGAAYGKGPAMYKYPPEGWGFSMGTDPQQAIAQLKGGGWGLEDRAKGGSRIPPSAMCVPPGEGRLPGVPAGATDLHGVYSFQRDAARGALGAPGPQRGSPTDLLGTGGGGPGKWAFPPHLAPGPSVEAVGQARADGWGQVYPRLSCPGGCGCSGRGQGPPGGPGQGGGPPSGGGWGNPLGKVTDPHPRERGGGAMGEEDLPRPLAGPVGLEDAPHREGRVAARLDREGAVEARPGRADPGVLGRRGRRTRGGCRS